MAEAVVAFGLASNVLQFIDFGFKLASRFSKYYRSSRDAEDVIPNIQLLTNELQKILHTLDTNKISEEISPGTYENRKVPPNRFDELAKDCAVVAQGLLGKLASLKKRSSDESKLSALKTAFMTIWREDDIARLQQRLDQFRSQLVLQLASESRDQIRSSEEHQMQVLREIKETVARIDGCLRRDRQSNDNLGSHIIDLVVSKIAFVDQIKQKTSLEYDLINSLLSETDLREGTESTVPVMSGARQARLTKTILEHLYYTSMVDREENIAEAHAETFRWVFDDGSGQRGLNWSSLPNWLASSGSTYWICGKAGSGKSTLMKYICQSHNTQSNAEARCDSHLRLWAPLPFKLVKATHFFWNSGADIQKSQKGLLRSLLHQVLSQVPSLVPLVMPKIWEALCLYGHVSEAILKDEQLMEMMTLVVGHLDEDTRLCLFIDGLDEFDGDHLTLVQLLEGLSRNPRVKLCVSSRPWEVFEATLNQVPSLRMELLTHDDILAYASARLLSNSDYNLLQSREDEYSKRLIGDIVEKASGVFLWVKLVVASLLSGLREGDRVIDLKRRLDMLPPDLENLYDKMLDSVDPFYAEHTAQLFTVISTLFNPVTVILLSYIDDESYESAISRPILPITSEERQVRFNTMCRRLNSRSMGLLEVSRPLITHDGGTGEAVAEPTVQYLHRTVHDYIHSPRIQSRLQEAMKKSFDVHMQICVGILAFLKTNGMQYVLSQSASPFWPITAQFMSSASNVSQRSHTDCVRVMEALNTTAGIMVMKRENGQATSDEQTNWYKSSGQWVGLHPAWGSDLVHEHFLSLAVMYGVCHYIESHAIGPCIVQMFRRNITTLSAGPRSEVPGSPHTRPSTYPLLLDTIIYKATWVKDWHADLPNVRAAESLIRKGARFSVHSGLGNFPDDPAIVLAKNLSSRLDQEAPYHGENQAWHKIIRLFIDHFDDIWPREMTKTLSAPARRAYRDLLSSMKRPFALVGTSIKSPKSNWTTVKPFMSYIGLTSTNKNDDIQQGRMELLVAMDNCFSPSFDLHAMRGARRYKEAVILMRSQHLKLSQINTTLA